MLRTKSILAPKESYDGLRISVMSRHTLNDGITPDIRITEDLFDEWKKEFAPPLKLLGNYYKRNLLWENFEIKYLNYLESIYNEVSNLAKKAIQENITLLCVEESPKRCHRRLLAEECKRIKPRLEILIN